MEIRTSSGTLPPHLPHALTSQWGRAVCHLQGAPCCFDSCSDCAPHPCISKVPIIIPNSRPGPASEIGTVPVKMGPMVTLLKWDKEGRWFKQLIPIFNQSWALIYKSSEKLNPWKFMWFWSFLCVCIYVVYIYYSMYVKKPWISDILWNTLYYLKE